MKIAVIAFEWPSETRRTGGVSHFNQRLCAKLAERGHQVTAFTAGPAAPAAGIRIETVPGRARQGRLFRYYAAPWRARKLDFFGFDLVLSSGDDWVMRHRGVPWIRIMHGSARREMFHNRRLIRKANLCLLYALEFWSALRSDAVLFNSEDTRALYPRRPQDRVVHLPIDTRRFRPGTKEKEPTLLFVGGMDSRKRGRWLLNLFVNRIRPAIPQARLWMVCDPDERHDGVEYFASPPLERLADLYRRAHVFCMPSTYEGYGIPYMEAMASGTLVVTTPNPGASELLRDGQYGWIAEDGELAVKLIEALVSPERHVRWTSPALEWARSHDWEALLPEFLAHGASVPDAAVLAVNEGKR